MTKVGGYFHTIVLSHWSPRTKLESSWFTVVRVTRNRRPARLNKGPKYGNSHKTGVWKGAGGRRPLPLLIVFGSTRNRDLPLGLVAEAGQKLVVAYHLLLVSSSTPAEGRGKLGLM